MKYTFFLNRGDDVEIAKNKLALIGTIEKVHELGSAITVDVTAFKAILATNIDMLMPPIKEGVIQDNAKKPSPWFVPDATNT
jgi:hypothetical protein